jgi:hypothetical protein
MFNLLNRFARSRSSSRPVLSHPRRAAIERLEDRQLYSVSSPVQSPAPVEHPAAIVLPAAPRPAGNIIAILIG